MRIDRLHIGRGLSLGIWLSLAGPSALRAQEGTHPPVSVAATRVEEAPD